MDKIIEKLPVSCGMKDLMLYVRSIGISNDMETINKIADIVGNASIADLKEAQKKDSTQFFFILKHVWPFHECVRFYEEHCSKVLKDQLAEIEKLDTELGNAKRKLEDLTETLSIRTAALEEQRKDTERAREELRVRNDAFSATRTENISLNKIMIEMEYDMVALKAHLYDLEKAAAVQNKK